MLRDDDQDSMWASVVAGLAHVFVTELLYVSALSPVVGQLTQMGASFGLGLILNFTCAGALTSGWTAAFP